MSKVLRDVSLYDQSGNYIRTLEFAVHVGNGEYQEAVRVELNRKSEPAKEH